MATSTKKMHERDLIGTHVVDFDERVDVKRLRRQRIKRLQLEITKAELGAILLFDPVNVRYATGTRLNETFYFKQKGRHALVPREGQPILFMATQVEIPYIENEVIGRPMRNFDSWRCGSFTEEATVKWAKLMKGTLVELGIAGERLGLDRLDIRSIHALELHSLRWSMFLVVAQP